MSLTEYAAAPRRDSCPPLHSTPVEALQAVTPARFPELVSIASLGLRRDAARAFRMPAGSGTRRYVQVIPLPLAAQDRVGSWGRKAVRFVKA